MRHKIDYVAKLNEIGRAGRAETLNAALYYEKAFKLSVKKPEQLDIKAWPENLPQEKQILLQNWVSANSKSLEQLKLGTKKSYYWPEYQGSSVWGVFLPGLIKARDLVSALCSRAKLCSSKGNFEEAFSDLLVCYRFGRHFTGPMFLTEQLVGIAISLNAVQDCFQILDKAKPDPDLLKFFQQKLQTLSSEETFVVNFTAEKFIANESIQMVFTDDGIGGSQLEKSDIESIVKMHNREDQMQPQAIEELILSWNKLERQQTTELAEKVYEYFGEVAHKTPWQLHNEGKDLKKITEEMTKDNPLLRMIVPAVSRVLGISFRGRAETDALITTVAIFRYKAEKGAYPANLQELLASGYLNELPIDPYSDGPLTYRCIDDDFTLYSLGADFKDDGGTPSKWGEGEQGGDLVFWPVGRKQK